SMLDIDRFKKINIRAQEPEEVYVDKNLAPECNVEFLKRCARLIPIINFADRWPRAFVRRTQNPLSLLWKVTRSTRPARTSWVEDSGGGFAGPVTRCQAPWWSIIL